MRGILAAVLALALSLLLNAGLFSFLPAMAYWRDHLREGPEARAREAALAPMPMMPKKREKPRSREAAKPQARKAPEPGRSVARQRFVMDLGAAGGTGAAVGGEALAKEGMEQAAFEEGESDEDARLLDGAPPAWPKEAEAAGVGGTVRCILTVGEDGRVADIRILEAPPGRGFEEAVRQAVARWKFKPAMDQGIPVRQRIEQSFKF